MSRPVPVTPRSRGILPVVTLLGAIAGCEAPPVVRPIGVSVTESGADAIQLAIEVEIENPKGNSSLRLLRWNYSFSLAGGLGDLLSGDATYTGEWAALTTLPAETTVRRRLPVVLPREAVERLGGERTTWRFDGELGYRDPSRFAAILYEFGWRPASGFSAERVSEVVAPPPPTAPAPAVPPDPVR